MIHETLSWRMRSFRFAESGVCFFWGGWRWIPVFLLEGRSKGNMQITVPRGESFLSWRRSGQICWHASHFRLPFSHASSNLKLELHCVASHLSICTPSFGLNCICGNRVKPYIRNWCLHPFDAFLQAFYKHFPRGRQVNDLLALFFMLLMSILIQIDD